jgi:hypothetical protein
MDKSGVRIQLRPERQVLDDDGRDVAVKRVGIVCVDRMASAQGQALPEKNLRLRVVVAVERKADLFRPS